MKIIKASYEILQFPKKSLEAIETAARTCYKSEDKIEPGSAERLVRPSIERRHKWYRSRKYGVDEDFFRVVESEGQAYALGYIFADGCVYNGECLKLASKDRVMVESIVALLHAAHPITTREKHANGKTYPIVETCIGSKRLVADLVALGCVPAKSKVDLHMPTIPVEVVHHFIRGYFDGDGGVRRDARGNLSACFVGSHSMLFAIRDALVVGARLTAVKVASHASIYRIGYHGNMNAKRLRDYLYKDANYWLERKRAMFFSADPKYGASGAKRAPPQMREVMVPLLVEFKLLAPIIFDDIEGERGDDPT